MYDSTTNSREPFEQATTVIAEKAEPNRLRGQARFALVTIRDLSLTLNMPGNPVPSRVLLEKLHDEIPRRPNDVMNRLARWGFVSLHRVKENGIGSTYYTLTSKGCRKVDQLKGIDPDHIDKMLGIKCMFYIQSLEGKKVASSIIHEKRTRLSSERIKGILENLCEQGFLKTYLATRDKIIERGYALTPAGEAQLAHISPKQTAKSSPQLAAD